MPKLYGLWNELPECCQQCQCIKSGDINRDIFEYSKNIILPTKKKMCGKQIKKREPIKERFKRFLSENNIEIQFKGGVRQYGTGIKKVHPYHLFARVFNWSNMPVGPGMLWAGYENTWRDILRSEYPEYVPAECR